MKKNDVAVANKIVKQFGLNRDKVVCDDGNVLVNLDSSNANLAQPIYDQYHWDDVSDGVQSGDVVVFVDDVVFGDR